MIYLPDTNIFSELSVAKPNQHVIRKMQLYRHHVFMASTVWHELLFGLNIMPLGKKQSYVSHILFNDLVKISVLAYDKTCANIHAKIRADARKSGKTLAFADSQIASIALAYDAVLVTRNVNDFSGIDGLKVENWFM